MKTITTLAKLEAIDAEPVQASLVKVVHEVTPEYRRLIEASPLAALATSGPEGLDCSPRGDRGQAVVIGLGRCQAIAQHPLPRLTSTATR